MRRRKGQGGLVATPARSATCFSLTALSTVGRRRHHAAALVGALLGGRGVDYRAVLSGGFRRAPGGDADEPRRNRIGPRSSARPADREPGAMIDSAAPQHL